MARQQFPKAGARLLRDLVKLYRLPPQSMNMDPWEYLNMVNQNADLNLPVSVRDLRVIDDMFVVLADVIDLSPACTLLKFLTDSPDQAALVVDRVVPGVAGLFLAQLVPDTTHLQSWARRMHTPALYMNTCREDTVLVAPLKAFAPC